ncbi:MAG: 16S rRNA (adenine(1518)-N(6)/adenine(1519)-N(6))-dimethyltransferase RsmA [Actinobacteria bacterium]|nr:16S rRNA (adenine(1518)-N(6)/adenine(1519)-N(6))-dimethyltransferase RsmA [Actinomycetota bacterium]
MKNYISSPGKTTIILSDNNIRLRKSLGQNYIIDTNSVKKMVSITQISGEDVILEIGCGIGSLTEVLLENGPAKIICIEVDRKVSEVFRNIFHESMENGQVELIAEDAMDIDYGKLSSTHNINKMISNLPYKIAAPLILKILRETEKITQFWMTIQKDIAVRLTAKPGDKNYSSYTVKSNTLACYRSCFNISRNCFLPKPFVDSSVIEVTRKKIPEELRVGGGIERFFDLVNASFAHRRKMLLNSLSKSKDFSQKLDSISELLPEIGKNKEVRAEELSLEDYIFLYKNLLI